MSRAALTAQNVQIQLDFACLGKIQSPHHVRLLQVDIGGARLNLEFMRYAVVLEKR